MTKCIFKGCNREAVEEHHLVNKDLLREIENWQKYLWKIPVCRNHHTKLHSARVKNASNREIELEREICELKIKLEEK
jgi:hypothetical protein